MKPFTFLFIVITLSIIITQAVLFTFEPDHILDLDIFSYVGLFFLTISLFIKAFIEEKERKVRIQKEFERIEAVRLKNLYERINKEKTRKQHTKTVKFNHFQILLGVDKMTKITKAAIKSNYRILARKFHPDFGGTDSDMQKLNEAYNFILNQYGFNN